ncbi:MAG: polysaccharide biosynthesis transport protein [Acidobacteriota bacterium]|jgi:capsular exopolysaccharide synthesis family protein|nr:polysaccharide biosynthesis transport protein [Acidobacteriota bacterium]
MQDDQKPILSLPEPRGLEKVREHASPQPSYGGYGINGDLGEEENHFKSYLRAIRKHLWLIIGITLIVTSLVTISVARRPDIYSAGARVQVDLETNPASGATGGKSGTVVINSVTSDPTYFNTQLQNLTSQGLLRRVVKTLDLEHNDAFLHAGREQNRSTWQSVLRMFGLGKKDEDKREKADDQLPLTTSVAPATAREDLVEAKRLDPFVRILQANLKVEPVKETRTGSYSKDTRLIDISYSHPDPQLAAKIVNTIADTFVFSNLEKKTETNASAGDFLQKRVAELQSNIRVDEERLVNYAKDHQILSLDGSQNTVVERLAGLNQQLLQAENDRKLAEAEYRAAQTPGAASALASKDAKQLDDLEGKLAQLKQKRQELLVENTEEWPEVRETNQQIAATEKQISDLRSRNTSTLTTNLETKYRQALDREKSIRDAFNEQRGETLTQNEAAINYRIIQQEIETNKQLLDGLLQRSKENDVVLAGTPNNIYVVDYAVTPDAPIGPQRIRTILMGLFLAFAGGIGLAIFLEYMNDSVRSTEDVERWLRLPSIGVIPQIGGTTRKRFLPSRALQRRNGNGHVQNSPELLTNVESRSALAESYRHLRTSVLLSSAGRAPKTLLVTSSMPAEGKTTTAVNTALSLAQTGATVLVIDADMRRPRVHSIFGLHNQRGLSTILSNDMSEAEMLSLIIQHNESGLNLLPSGAIPPNPAELLGSDQMRRLINTLELTFDHIIIDSPPIGSFTDGVLTSTLVDGVLLVVHSGKTSRSIARRTRQILQDVGAKVFGVVLNNVNLREHDYYYYQSYQSNSYYKADQEAEQAIGS